MTRDEAIAAGAVLELQVEDNGQMTTIAYILDMDGDEPEPRRIVSRTLDGVEHVSETLREPPTFWGTLCDVTGAQLTANDLIGTGKVYRFTFVSLADSSELGTITGFFKRLRLVDAERQEFTLKSSGQ